MMTELLQESQQIQQLIRQGADWLTQYEEPEKRLATLDDLGRLRRRAKRLEGAAALRPALALFGESQVGKSYLVSNLARIPGQNLLRIETAGIPEAEAERILGHALPINFIDDINPPGSGAEATGVVTRFTTHHQNNEGGYLLRLLSQADLVKILAVGYLANITGSEYQKNLKPEYLDQVLARLEAGRQATVQPGFTADDVLDLRDYLPRYFGDKQLVGKLQDHGYWDKVATFIEYLDAAQREQIFAPLWHEDAYTSHQFRKLSEGLTRLRFAREVRCGLEAIAPQRETIVDVMRLYEMDDPARNKGDVTIRTPDGQAVPLNRSVLTALTAELVLPLPKALETQPSRRFLQHADVLDFPGARSMDGIAEEVFRQPETAVDTKMAPFLRGKVYYLFNSYNDAFGISSLLFCIHNMQSNVKGTLSHYSMVYQWIEANIGKTVADREQRERRLSQLVPLEFQQGVSRINPFFLTLTKINIEINNCDLGKAGRPEVHDTIWTKRLNLFFNDEMKKVTTDRCVEQWNQSDGSFKNTFLIRDPAPRYSEPAYLLQDGHEAYSPRFEPVFQDLETSFVRSESVQRHFYDPQRAWNESIRPAHNGVDYLTAHLLPACHSSIKHQQIQEALALVRQEVGKALCRHYEGGSLEEKLARARRRAEQAKGPLGRILAAKRFGALLTMLGVSEQYAAFSSNGLWDRELARQALDQPEQFIRKANQVTVPAEPRAAPVADAVSLIDDLLGLGPAPAAMAPPKSARVPSLASTYTEALLGQWVAHLSALRSDPAFLRTFQLSEEEADVLLEEIVRGMERDGLKERLASRLAPHLTQPRHLEIVLSIGRALLNEFVNTLGWSRVPNEDKTKNRALFRDVAGEVRPIFEGTPVPVLEKTQLVPHVEDPGRALYSQWVPGFIQSFEYNVLREANVSDPERARINGELERLIKQVGHACE
jgi:hypothetical protein